MIFFKKHKFLFLSVIGLFILSFIMATWLFIPPRDAVDDLDLLYLDTTADEAPLFRMHPQQTYYLDSAWTEPSPSSEITSEAAEVEPSPTDIAEPSLLVEPSVEAAWAEPSLINTPSDMPLHLMVTVDEDFSNIEQLVTQLAATEKYVPYISLSLIPDGISDEVYIEFASMVHRALQSYALKKVKIIWYPPNEDNLSLYDLDIVENVGVVIQSTEDISMLDKVYSHFSDSATLYVRDAISHFFKDDVSKAVQTINAMYYLMAARYPKIDTIFSPYRTHTAFSNDAYYLDSASPDYATLCAIYYQLANKSWITFSNDVVSNESPYKSLESYTVLSGQVEMILAPHSDLLSNIPGQAQHSTEATYLTYKLDELMIPVQTYYPYVLHLDTTKYANGVSRIKASSYNPNNEVIETQSVDIEISNPVLEMRSNRVASHYSLEEKVIYNTGYIPILMYHSILDSVSEEEQNSCVETSVFESQIKGLLEAGYTPINFKTLKDYTDGMGGLPEKPILITMDDGYLNNYTHAYPIFQKYNVPATLFVSPYYMSKENTKRHFGWKAAREMEASGLIDIQSHGYNHTPFPYISLKELRYHISHSFGLIEQNLGARDVYVVACPQFRNTLYTRKLLTSLGIDLQITKLIKRGTVLDTSNLKRINVPNTMTPEELISKIESVTM